MSKLLPFKRHITKQGLEVILFGDMAFSADKFHSQLWDLVMDMSLAI